MEKIIVRYLIFLKSAFKDRLMWLNLILMLCLAVLFSGVVTFDKDTTRVMIYGESDAAAEVMEKLTSLPSVFNFERADSVYELEENVRSGSAECGFIFNDGFEKYFSGGEDGGVIFAASPFTVKGIAAKETVFAVLMDSYAGDVLAGEGGNIFKDEKAGMALTMDYYGKIRQSGEVFNVDFEGIGEKDEVNERKSRESQMVHLIVWLLIFAYGLFAELENLFGRYSSFGKAFPFAERGVIFMEKRLAALTIPCCYGFITIRYLEATVPFARDLILMLLLLVFTLAVVTVFAKIFKREESYICWSLLLIAMLFCSSYFYFTV